MIKNQIPKKIHYCWFGKHPLPKSALKCIQSWKKYFPDYEIIQWDESNYDVNKIKYIKDAYRAKQYAFVSDYARFDILYHEGGIYFDTDVEVIKSFEEILKNGSFMGCEIDGLPLSQYELNQKLMEKGKKICKTKRITVSPGLGMAAVPGLNIYKDILDFYQKQNFFYHDGTINQETVGMKITGILLEKGLKNIKGIQKIEEITIYPKEYFNPLTNNTGIIDITENTHSVHKYSMSWISPMKRVKSRITRIFHRIFGENCFSFFKNS